MGGGGGMMGGGIASTLAAARNEIDDMPKPVTIKPSAPAGPTGGGPKPTLLSVGGRGGGRGMGGGRGGMMGRGGGMMRPGGGDMMMMNSALQAPAPGRAPNRGHFDDDLNDGPDFGALPSLDDAPKFGARGGSGGGMRIVDQIKPPTFDDDLDEEEMAREEAEMLARVRAQKAKAEGRAEAPAPIQAIPAFKGSGGGGKSSGSSPLRPGGLDTNLVDDLSDEEIL